MKIWVSAIVAIGVIRFVLSLSGVSDNVVRYVSMSAVIFVALVYCAIVISARRERFKAAYQLIVPYMIIEVSALSYTWMTGRRTIFSIPEYSLGTTIGVHTIGHLVGGLTWEPLIVFLLMEVIRLAYLRVRG